MTLPGLTASIGKGAERRRSVSVHVMRGKCAGEDDESDSEIELLGSARIHAYG